MLETLQTNLVKYWLCLVLLLLLHLLGPQDLATGGPCGLHVAPPGTAGPRLGGWETGHGHLRQEERKGGGMGGGGYMQIAALSEGHVKAEPCCRIVTLLAVL